MVKQKHFTAKWAKFWGVTQRTVQRWVKDSVPVDDVEAMVVWARTQKRLPKGFSAKLAALRAGVSVDADPDWAEFEKQLAENPEAGGEENEARLERYRDFFAFKLNKAIKAGQQDEIKYWEARFVTQEKAIRESKLLAEKLGLDNGETLRKHTEAFVRSLAFWTMRSTDDLLAYISPKLVGLTFPEEVRAVLEPVMLDARFVGPLARASAVEGEAGLPDWVPGEIKRAVGNYIEHGEAAFEEHVTR